MDRTHHHIVKTSPTASLPDRAARVAEVINATARRVSGSDFDRRRFEALWADVPRFLVPDAARQPKRGRAAGRPPAKKATSRKKARQR